MTLLTWVLAGALLAAVLVALVARSPRELSVWTAGLAIAALAYPVFALIAGAGALKEIVAALPWLAAALLARRTGPAMLGLAWALHGVLDLLPVDRPWMPAFYPPLCLGFDLVAAVRLLWMRERR